MYESETLASILDQLQILNYMYGSQAGDDNPIPEPVRHTRPEEIYMPRQAQEVGMSEAEFSAQFD